MHKLFPTSPFFDFETVRILGTTVYGGADAAEVLEAVGDIKPNDPVSWEQAWATQATRAEALADDAAQHGNRDAARRAYLRAANYTRAKGYMYVSSPAPDSGRGGGAMRQDPRALPTAEKVGELFRKAIPLMEGPVLTLSIPYEGGFHLPAYLYLPPASCRRAVLPKPRRGPGAGYAVLTFDGPGQGMMLRKHNLEMRPDWEAVTGCVISHLVQFSKQNPQLDLDVACIAVSGASMGGYFALRAAVDPSVKACVSIDPFYDMWDFDTAHVSPLFISAWTQGWIGQAVAEKEEGTSFLSRVTCPVLVSGAGLANVPDRDKEIWVPSSEGQGSLQAKMGALALLCLSDVGPSGSTSSRLGRRLIASREPRVLGELAAKLGTGVGDAELIVFIVTHVTDAIISLVVGLMAGLVTGLVAVARVFVPVFGRDSIVNPVNYYILDFGKKLILSSTDDKI
ncbi:hypothetical protein PG994_004919 [Apiospora phragmitis]|uniref:Alpha/beta hydrolase n=1 Tax=Apiospora phragmitis TaxID=2905665 RepID=A0ABR1VRY3_9PEZI